MVATTRKAKAALTVVVPRCWSGAIASKHNDLVVLHPPADCRQAEVALALALDCAGDAVIVCTAADFPRVRATAASWLAGRGRRSQVGKASVWELSGRRLAIARSGSDAALIGGYWRLAISLSSHAVQGDPTPSAARRVYISEMPRPGHWLCDNQAFSTAVRVDWQAVAKELSGTADQLNRLTKRLSVDSRARYLELKDVEPRQTPLLTFCRKRLWIRTDKPAEYLSPEQQAHAFKQLGSGWERSGLAPVVPMIMHPIQRRVAASKRLGRSRGYRKFICVKYRRAGYTTEEQAESYLCAVEQDNSHVGMVADTDARGRALFRMTGLFLQRDPEAPAIIASSGSQIELANGSTLFVGTAGGKAIGRGFGLQRVHGLEVSYWCRGPRQQERVRDVMSGLTEAASNGELSMESTPAGREWVYETYKEAKSGRTDWWPIFLRWFDDPRNVAQATTYKAEEVAASLTAEETALVAKHGLTPGQIAFRRAKKTALRGLFLQEYPEDDETCFLTSGVCLFDVPIVMAALERCRLPLVDKHTPGGYERRWEQPQPGVQYVLGGDTSEGLPGGDRNGLCVMRKDTGRIVCVTHGYFNIRDQAANAARISKDYNDALILIERENHGHAVLEALKTLGVHRPHYRGGNLYYCTASDARSAKEAEEKSKPGWTTNQATRPVMLDEIATAVDTGVLLCDDRDFLSECLGVRRQPSGKFEAVRPEFDDAVMKTAIAWQGRKVRRPQGGGFALLEGAI